MSEEKEILLGYLIGSISILRDMHIQFTEKSRNKLADKIMELLTAYEKEKAKVERIKDKLAHLKILAKIENKDIDRIKELEILLKEE